MLRKNIFTSDEIISIVRDYHQAGLPPEEIAVMSFAEKVTLDPQSVTQEDVDQLREFAMTDAEILDITLAAAARNSFSKVLDALGVEPDTAYLDLEPELRQALTIGRPFVKND